MSERSTHFSIEDWRVEPSRGRIVHRLNGTVTHIRPKSMAVLEALAAAGGEVLTRETLLETIWPDAVVSDESLTRCIADLRQAMGDSGRAPRYVETVPKRGYRLIPPVTWTRKKPTADGTSSDPSTTTGPAAPGGVATEAMADNFAKGSRSLMGWSVLALTVIAVMVLLWRNLEEPVPAPVVAVLPPVEPGGAAVGKGLLDMAAVDLLFQRLSEIPQIRVRGPASLYGTDDPVAGAGELGATHALEVRTDDVLTGDKLQAAVWLHDLEAGPAQSALMGRFDLPLLDSDTDIETFLGIRERVAERVVDRLLPALDVPPDGTASPQNANANRQYLQARDRLGRPGCEGTGPNRLLEASLDQDPGFVPAWVALGWANYALASTCGLGPQHYEDAISAAEEALIRAPDWLPAVALKATVLVETGDAEAALELLRRYLARFPGSAALHYAASYATYYQGDLEEAEQQLRATLELDPFFLTAEGWTPNVLLYQQRYDEFLALLPATRSTLFDFYRGFALFRLGQPEAARPLLADGYAENPTDVFGRLSGALLALLDDSPETAIAIVDTLAHERRTHGIADGEVAYRLAQLAALAGDESRTRAQLEAASDLGFRCDGCIRQEPLFEGLMNTSSVDDGTQGASGS